MKKYIYIYIGAEWCPKCKVYKPKFEEYCKKNELSYKVVDADDESEKNFIETNGVRNVPIIVRIDPSKPDEKGELITVDDFLKD